MEFLSQHASALPFRSSAGSSPSRARRFGLSRLSRASPLWGLGGRLSEASGARRHSRGVALVRTAPLVDSIVRANALDVAGVYADHCDFVWRTLQHLGVRGADLEDLMQEVFVVVHRKLDGFDGRSRITTWLFGISLRVVGRHRRRAYFRFERQEAEVPETADARTP